MGSLKPVFHRGLGSGGRRSVIKRIVLLLLLVAEKSSDSRYRVLLKGTKSADTLRPWTSVGELDVPRLALLPFQSSLYTRPVLPVQVPSRGRAYHPPVHGLPPCD